MTKQSFPIPEGCKAVTVEQIGNQIITTFEPTKKERQRVQVSTEYFLIDAQLNVTANTESLHAFDNIRHKCGNYFKSKAQAQRAADRLKAELDKFWEEELEF